MKLNWFNVGLEPTFRMEEDDGLGGGGNVVLENLSDGGDNETGGEEDDNTPQTPPAGFDTAALARTLGDTLGEKLKGILPAQQQKQITPEEAMKMLNYWEPDDQWLQQFGNIDTQKQAVIAMRDGLTRQFMTIVNALVQDREAQIHSKYEPVLTWKQEQEKAAREARFDKKYTQLADPNLKPIVYSVIGHLKTAGTLTGDETKDFEAIARGVEALIKTQNPNFRLEVSTAGGQTKQKPGSGSRIPVTSHGGGGGGSHVGGDGGKAQKNTVLKFL